MKIVFHKKFRLNFYLQHIIRIYILSFIYLSCDNDVVNTKEDLNDSINRDEEKIDIEEETQGNKNSNLFESEIKNFNVNKNNKTILTKEDDLALFSSENSEPYIGINEDKNYDPKIDKNNNLQTDKHNLKLNISHANILAGIAQFIKRTKCKYVGSFVGIKNRCVILYHISNFFKKSFTVKNNQKKLFTNDDEYIKRYNKLYQFLSSKHDSYFQFKKNIKDKNFNKEYYIKRGIYKIIKKNKAKNIKGANGIIYILAPYKDKENQKIDRPSKNNYLIIKILMPKSYIYGKNAFKELQKEIDFYNLLNETDLLRCYSVPTVMICIDKIPILIKKYVDGQTLKKLIEEDKADGFKLNQLYKMFKNIKAISDVEIKDLHPENIMWDSFIKNWKIVDADINIDVSKSNASQWIKLKISTNKHFNRLMKTVGSYLWAMDKKRHIIILKRINEEIKKIKNSDMVEDPKKINLESKYLNDLEILTFKYGKLFSLEFFTTGKIRKDPTISNEEALNHKKLSILHLAIFKIEDNNIGDLDSIDKILDHYPHLITVGDDHFNYDIFQISCLVTSSKLVEYLREKFADKININQKDKYGHNCLHLLCDKSTLKNFYGIYKTFFKKNLDYGQNYEMFMKTIGSFACTKNSKNQKDIANELIDNLGIKKELMDKKNGDTPLHLCANSGYLELYEYLVKHKQCDPEKINKQYIKPNTIYKKYNAKLKNYKYDIIKKDKKNKLYQKLINKQKTINYDNETYKETYDMIHTCKCVYKSNIIYGSKNWLNRFKKNQKIILLNASNDYMTFFGSETNGALSAYMKEIEKKDEWTNLRLPHKDQRPKQIQKGNFAISDFNLGHIYHFNVPKHMDDLHLLSQGILNVLYNIPKDSIIYIPVVCCIKTDITKSAIIILNTIENYLKFNPKPKIKIVLNNFDVFLNNLDAIPVYE